MKRIRKGVIRIGRYRIGIIFLLVLAVAGVLASPQATNTLSMMGVSDPKVEHGDWLIGYARCMDMDMPIRSPEDLDGWFTVKGDYEILTPRSIQMGTVGGWDVTLKNLKQSFWLSKASRTLKIEICKYDPETDKVSDCGLFGYLEHNTVDTLRTLSYKEALKLTNPTAYNAKKAEYYINADQYGMYTYRPMVGYTNEQVGCDILAGDFHTDIYLKAITHVSTPDAAFLNVEEKRLEFEKTEKYTTASRMYPGQYFNYPDTLMPTFVDPYTYEGKEVTCKASQGGGRVLYGYVDLKTVGNVLYRVPNLNNEVAAVECCPGDTQPITGEACSESTFTWINEEDVECSLTRPCPSSLSRPHDETTLKKVTCDIGGTNKCTIVEYIDVECTTSAVCSPGQVCANNVCTYTGSGAIRPPDALGRDGEDGDGGDGLSVILNRIAQWLSDNLGIPWSQAKLLVYAIILIVILIVLAPVLKALMGAGAMAGSAAPAVTVVKV